MTKPSSLNRPTRHRIMIRFGLICLSLLPVLLGYKSIRAQTEITPYVSAVPKFTFADTLEGQEEQLKSNPLMLRFAESRNKLKANRSRPIYHMSSPEGRLGDPNGLAFWHGNWHLFYQGYPPDDNRQHWGHAVSPDLIHWRDLPYAIYPGPEQAVYSGSTYVEDDRVIAMYHGPMAGNMIAVSDDPLLLNWRKILNHGSAVIPMASPTGFPLPYSVFDPSIWKEDGIYYSLSAGKGPDGPAGRDVPIGYLFRSKNLKDWEYAHKFVEGDRFTMIGDDYACPYFWPIGDRHIMYFFSHKSGGQYLIGDYDKVNHKFIPTSASGPLDLGPPSSTTDGKGGTIVVYRVGGVVSIPRRMTLIGADEVRIEPAGNLESLRGEQQSVNAMTLAANKEIVLDGVSGDTLELNMEIDLKGASAIELEVLRSPEREEFTRITFFKEGGVSRGGRNYGLGLSPVTKGEPIPPEYYTAFNGSLLRFLTNDAPLPAPAPGGRGGVPRRTALISADTTYSSLNGPSRGPLSASVLLDANETLKLRVFIDKGVVEVFANSKQALSFSVDPTREDSVGVSLRSSGEDSELKSFEAWRMKGIY